MTLEQLEQYNDKCREAKMWARELDEMYGKAKMLVKDTVVGSSAEYPYTSHPVSIKGIPLAMRKRIEAREERYRRRMVSLEIEVQAIEDYIDGLQDSQLRQIIHYRYVKGYSWVKVARMIGGSNSVSAVKMRVNRHFGQSTQM